MNLSEELSRLNDLKQCGALSEEEFEVAKAKLIASAPSGPSAPEAAPPAAASSPASPGSAPAGSSGINVNQWCMFIHFSQFAGFIIPFAGLVVPIVLWQMKKADSPLIDLHGKIVVNWIITACIGFAICFVLAFVLIGIPMMIVLSLVSIIFGIMGGIKAGNGEAWNYPMTIRFIK